MVTITLAVPNELKVKMDEFQEINWSAVARQAFAQKIKQMEVIKKFAEKSELTEEDAIELGRIINRSAAEKLGI